MVKDRLGIFFLNNLKEGYIVPRTLWFLLVERWFRPFSILYYEWLNYLKGEECLFYEDFWEMLDDTEMNW